MAVSFANDDRARDLRIAKRSQYTLLVLASIVNFSTGTYIAWTTVALPIFNRHGDPVSNQAASWICSSVALGAIIGSLPAGTIADRISRKRSILISSLLLSSCWFVIGFARSKLWIFVARFTAGLSCGASSILIPLYLSEITTDRVKESSGMIFQLQTGLGILFAYSLDFADNLTAIAVFCAFAPGFLAIATKSIPESPIWLIRHSRHEEAAAAQEILSHFRVNGSTEESSRRNLPISELWLHRKATIVALGMTMFQQLSGMNTVISYATMIFQYIRFPLSSTSCSIIVGLTYVIATLSSRSLIDRTKRKLLLFLSLSIMSVCMFILSGYFRLKDFFLSVGQTFRLLETRIRERRHSIFLPPARHTALARHSIEFDHAFDFENVKIVEKEANLHQRILLETIHMIKHHSVNLRTQKTFPTLLGCRFYQFSLM
ncbi:solute carrier family 2, facilitated glucose transporter member 8-like isoform X2 [Lasioglossum baleicum]|uniref:solute carrier family 2, facilitated glucose transporter member 8-like isoform X2 n=1 Tax=Lasioglossum baleicum TaxID=434251 RepID=UPI003FCCE81D